MMLVNVAVLVLCLVAVIVFKQIVADRTAGFMQVFAPPDAGSGEGSEGRDGATLSIDVAKSLIYQSVEQATRARPTLPSTPSAFGTSP